MTFDHHTLEELTTLKKLLSAEIALRKGRAAHKRYEIKANRGKDGSSNRKPTTLTVFSPEETLRRFEEKRVKNLQRQRECHERKVAKAIQEALISARRFDMDTPTRLTYIE